VVKQAESAARTVERNILQAQQKLDAKEGMAACRRAAIQQLPRSMMDQYTPGQRRGGGVSTTAGAQKCGSSKSAAVTGAGVTVMGDGMPPLAMSNVLGHVESALNLPLQVTVKGTINAFS
jgi:hypothetical protein